MSDRIFKPKCPQCGRVQADWVKEAKFTCPRCHLTFVIGETEALDKEQEKVYNLK